MRTHFILYVEDQDHSTEFYARVLGREPSLNVPGMTEFELDINAVLGLMPEARIKALLGPALGDPTGARGVPRSEVYLLVEDAEASHQGHCSLEQGS